MAGYRAEALEVAKRLIVLQVNGKVRDRIEVPASLTKRRSKQVALANERVLSFVGQKPVKKVIVVGQKLSTWWCRKRDRMKRGCLIILLGLLVAGCGYQLRADGEPVGSTRKPGHPPVLEHVQRDRVRSGFHQDDPAGVHQPRKSPLVTRKRLRRCSSARSEKSGLTH